MPQKVGFLLSSVSTDHPSGLDFGAKFLKLSVTIQKLPDTQNWTWKYWDVHSNTMYCIISNKVLGVPHCKMTNGTAYGRIGQWCYHWYMTSVERSPFGIDKDGDRAYESHPIAVDFEDVSNLGHIDELIDQPLAVHFGQNAPLIVIPAKQQLNRKTSQISNCLHYLSARPIVS